LKQERKLRLCCQDNDNEGDIMTCRQRHGFVLSRCAAAVAALPFAAMPLSALAALSSPAAEDADAPVVLVSAAMLPPGLGIDPDRLPYTVQSASERARRDSGIDETSEFMARRLAGVNANEVQGNALQNDLSFRGFRLSPTLGAAQGMSVYLDGVRANEPFGDVMNWDMLPQAAIDDVLLVSGANPLYGLNTLGGTLAFTTKSGRSHAGTDATLSLGSHGRQRIDLSWGGRFADGWHAFAAGTLFDEAGWRAHAGGSLGNLFAKIGRADGATDWDLSLLHGRSRLRGNGLLPSGENAGTALYDNDRSAAYTYPDITENRLSQLTLHLRHTTDDDTELALTAYVRHSRRDAVNGDVNANYGDYVEACADGFDAAGDPLSPDACAYRRSAGALLHTATLNGAVTRQRSAGATLNLTRDLGAHQLLFGTAIDLAKVSYSQTGQDAWFTADRGVVADPAAPVMPDASVDGHSAIYGIYASDTWRVARGTFLTASARFNHARVVNTLAGQPTERFAYNRLNPSLGVVHELGANAALFANVADSNRVPTVIELGCADPLQPCRLPVGLQSDPYLKQVVSRTVEAGLRWQPATGTTASMSVYRSTSRDDILFFTSGTSQQGYFANFERTLREGADLALKTRRSSIEAGMSWSYLRAVYDASGTLFAGVRNVQVAPGMPIAGLPRHTVKLDLDWHASQAVTVGADVVAVSRMTSQGNEDGLRSDPVAGAPPDRADLGVRGHATLNLHASWRNGKAWEIFGRVTNLFDRRYETWGAVGRDFFPGGALVQPHVAAGDAAQSLFVAPGAPRTVLLGVRFRM
jgi:outer membrane receptor protein involved in Fe transport